MRELFLGGALVLAFVHCELGFAEENCVDLINHFSTSWWHNGPTKLWWAACCFFSKEQSVKIWRALGDKRGSHVKGHVRVTFIENTIW